MTSERGFESAEADEIDRSPGGERRGPGAEPSSEMAARTFSPFDEDPAAIPVEELRRGYRRLGMLYELAQQLFTEAALPSLFERIVSAAVELLDVERALLATSDDGSLVARASHGLVLDPAGPIPISSTMVARVLERGEVILTFDALRDREYSSTESIVENQIRSVMCCPLGNPREPTGLLYVDNNVRDRAFDRSDVRFLQALSHYAHIAIQGLTRVESERELAKARVDTLQRAYGPGHELVGKSPKTLALYQLIRRVAPARVPVLILGETGTGKEVVARAIHQESDRHEGPFVPVNMGTLSRETAVSQLFGHERGAFTGATTSHPGFFVQADRGVIFLDEITATPPDIQVMLLRTLQEGVVRPLGSRREIPVDVRVITASNVDIDAQVRDHHFREDLFFRLNVVRLEVPPLRERREDIAPLAHHFLAKLAPGRSFDPEAMRWLCAYTWRGNVRELRNVIESLAILAPGDVIHADDLPTRVVSAVPGGPPPTPAEEPESLHALLDRIERDHIQRTLDYTHGHREKAMKILGIARATFYQKLREYGLMDYKN